MGFQVCIKIYCSHIQAKTGVVVARRPNHSRNPTGSRTTRSLYSYLMTNQFGLGIDNIAGFEVVLPSGKVVNARPNDDTADLYNSLRVISQCSPCFCRAHGRGREVVPISAS